MADLSKYSNEELQRMAAAAHLQSLPDDQLKQLAESAKAPQESGSVLGNYIRGVGRGLMDNIEGAAQTMTHALPSGVVNGVNSATNYVNNLPLIGPATKALGMTPSTPQQLDQIITKNEADYQAQTPGSISAGLGRGTGNLLPLLLSGGASVASKATNAAKGTSSLFDAVRGGAKVGGLTSALQPVTDLSNPADYWKQKAIQVGVGAGIGAAVPPIGKGLNTLWGSTLGPAASKATDWASSKIPGASSNFDVRKVAQAFQRDNIPLNDVKDAAGNLITPGINSRLLSYGKGGTLTDVGGENVLALAKGAANLPGPQRQMAADLVASRRASRGDQLVNAASASLGGGDFNSSMSAWATQRAKDAAPLYEKAFQGGSIAPLEHQFNGQYNDAVKAVSDATKRVSQAESAVTSTQAKLQQAGSSAYARSPLVDQLSTAQKELAAANAAHAQAQAGQESILARLRQAQADGTANAPGAVWSPRVQQFLDDPIAKQGLKQGLAVQRLEALAEGRPFDPTELAIKGADEAGNPIVGAVPNMRTLDAVKRGLDNILDGYRDGVTGKLNLDQYGRAVDQVRRAFVSELDNLNPDYAAARQAFAGPSQLMDAARLGQRFASRDPEVTTQMLNGMTDSEKDAFRTGALNSVKGMINSDTARAAGKFDATKAQFLDRLQSTFPDADSFNAFKQTASKILDEQRRDQMINPRFGSQTAPLQAQFQDMSVDPGKFFHVIGPAAEAPDSTVAWLKSIGRGIGAGYNALQDWGKTPPQGAAEGIGRMLFSTDPTMQQQAISSMQPQGLLGLVSPQRIPSLPWSTGIFPALAGKQGGQFAGQLFGSDGQ